MLQDNSRLKQSKGPRGASRDAQLPKPSWPLLASGSALEKHGPLSCLGET